MTENKICRICLENDGQRMIAPCKCKGTNKWIHRLCLDHWRCESEVAFKTCPTCKTNYVLDLVPNVDVEKERRQLFRMLTLDISIVLLGFSICSYFFGVYLSDCSTTSWKHPGCESTNPFVLGIVGGTYLFFLIGYVFFVIMAVLNGGNVFELSPTKTTTSPILPPRPLNSVEFFLGWFFFLVMAVVGMIVVFSFCRERINSHWEKHTAKRERSIKVTDYVVRDLSNDLV